jgi:hypothetical protein
MMAWVVVSAETHFTAVVSGTQTNIRIERSFTTPEAAQEYVDDEKMRNVHTQYTIEQIEVRS